MKNQSNLGVIKRNSLGQKFVGVLAGVVVSGSVIAGVDIEQEPLTVQTPLEPNILFILDDSGSMAWEAMPDSLDRSPDNRNEHRIFTYSGENLIYYNPATTYTPPVKADGTSWGNASYPDAKRDGFCTGGGCSTRDIFDTGYYERVYTSSNSYNEYATDGDGDKINVFVYHTKSGGTYTRHYIAEDCTGSTNTNSLANCDDSAATQQNLANWYSYYRSRILLAKSSAMIAFNDLNEDYRFGFGELNDKNDSSSHIHVVDKDNSSTQVAVFGDGSAGTRKYEFYDWLADTTAASGTPLRERLDKAGRYFKTDHPWESVESGVTYKHACRQSFTILTSDGYWNGDTPSGIDEQDDANGSTITGPNGQTYQYVKADPYKDSTDDTLADVAMKYWKNDLKTNIDNEVPTSDEDPAFWQHMVTFTIGLGLTPTGISPSGTTVDDIFDWANGGSAISGFSWPAASDGSSNNVADMAHAGLNGHGGFYSAKNPTEFQEALQDALARTSSRIGSAASLAANSTKLDSGTFTYQANYFTGKWEGDLKAYAVDATTGAISNTATWSASNQLPAHGSRNLYTYNPDGATYADKYVEFDDPADLSTDQQTALGADATARQNMIDYIRGDDANEQSNSGSFRNRDSYFADIVNSQPVYVASPNANLYGTKSFTGASSYYAFAASVESRVPTIYVASNDGVLHGLTASTGEEVFGYIPAAVVLEGFDDISNPEYGDTNASTLVPHKYYNDGEMSVADVYISGAWKTVLVGTTGRGSAKSIYALDITDPANVSFLWERYADDGQTNSNYIGQMTGKPIIAQTASGWRVFIGNGYNSASDKAALLSFDIASGNLAVGIAGSSTSNGMSSPALLDTNNDGIQDVAYGGDYLGAVWEFTTLASDSTVATPKFEAKDSSNAAQPITGGLLVGIDPDTDYVWLFFGTGSYLNDTDKTDLSTQSLYGIIVDATATIESNLANELRSVSLVERTIFYEQAATSTTLAARAFSSASAGDMTGKSGWFMDLTSPLYGAEGERVGTPAQFQGTALVATTRIPKSIDPCNPSGTGWVLALDPFTGGALPSSFFDYDYSGTVDASDKVTSGGTDYPIGAVGFDALPNNPIFVGNQMLMSFDDGTTSSIATSGGTGAVTRQSWREIY